MKIPGLLRLEYALISNAKVLIVVLALVSVLSLAGTGAAVIDDSSQEVQEEINRQTVTTEVDHKAVVTANDSLWDQGTVLENREFYPLNDASDLTLTVRSEVDGAPRMYGSHSLTVVYYSKVDGNRIWERTSVISPSDKNNSNDAILTTFVLPVSEIFDRMDQYNEKLTGVSRTSVELRLQTNYSTMAYSGGYSSTVPLTLSNSGYQLGGSFQGERTHTTTITRTENSSPATSNLFGLLAMAVLSAGAAEGLRRLSQIVDVGDLKDEIHRQRCSEWISEGHIRQPIGGQDVMMTSLEDLVYVAIDSKERVIHDPDRDLYAIMDDGMLFYYDPLEVQSAEALNSEEVASESETPEETPDQPSEQEEAEITIGDHGNYAWDRLMEDELANGDSPARTGDSSEGDATSDGDRRAWNELMDGGE